MAGLLQSRACRRQRLVAGRIFMMQKRQGRIGYGKCQPFIEVPEHVVGDAPDEVGDPVRRAAFIGFCG